MMQQLSEEGRQRLSEIANRHGVSFGAVEHLLMAVMAGQGNQAQFNHPDLGGMGQWSLGGMTMVGDMFNNSLKARVDALCTELSNLVRSTSGLMQASSSFQSQSQGGGYGSQQSWNNGGGTSLFVPGSLSSGNWWPQDLGFPASTGAQNNLRYAFFPATRRLAIDLGGSVTVYDTGDHSIGGFSQQQGGDQSLTFTSQYGLVRVADLPIISGVNAATPPVQAAPAYEPPVTAYVPEPVFVPAPAPFVEASVQAPVVAAAPAISADDVFEKIERIAALHAKGILTDDEFQTKKAELLARL
ncbi:hypothetical protein GGQ66_001108 [Rhizobium borbori]|uniref:SHOCT domain-containing protein n=2 Tax=Allorhizobium borbori TaxID=485907 RepID=A0A7W6JZT8_9HYPH|nr:SHOCT domain-containing protein [Allorhizobium borbori]MBB4102573.1 hypothetical protein [Allorhizobium borbori]